MAGGESVVDLVVVCLVGREAVVCGGGTVEIVLRGDLDDRPSLFLNLMMAASAVF